MKNAIYAAIAATVLLSACASPTPVTASAPAVHEASGRWADLSQAIAETMRRNHYNPAELQTPAYKEMEARIADLATTAETREDFVRDFNAAWRDGPFSHVRIDVARSSAADTAAFLDSMRVGGSGAKLEWRQDVAILTVNTMMGADTIEQINAAFDEIAGRPARGLVIDLRNNDGGAFAGIPLVGHTLDKPYDAGVFVSQLWAREMNRAPSDSDIAGIAPWKGWSITSFWRDVQDNRLTRIQFEPVGPIYAGPVFVLVSAKTFSAAEMTADAFKGSGRATLVGEKTLGRMLSQKMYDLPEGLQLSLPIADYYSLDAGRIEGVGVTPHVTTAAADALDFALAKLGDEK